MFLEIPQNSQENICARFFFNLFSIKKETPAQVFSCEFWEISKNIFSYRLPPAAASVLKKKFKANKRIDKGHSLKSELETGDPRP